MARGGAGRSRTRARRRPAPPELTGHRVVGPLGFGANGPAWAARSETGDDVVVSVLPLSAGASGRSRLRRLAALRDGSHPHLAQVREVQAIDASRCAVITDRVTGPALDTVVRARGELTEAELYALLQSGAGALAHLHARGVIHGDVSPSNVVLSGAGDPVLVDLAGQLTHEAGTEGFVAPERHHGQPATPAGDVWALARLVQWAAGPAPPRRLIDALGEALRAAPQRRPAAAELARAAAALGEYRPITLPPAAVLAQARMRAPDAVTRRRPSGRREVRALAPRTGARARAAGTRTRTARRTVVAAAVVAAAGLAVGGLVVGPRLWPSGPAPVPPVPTAPAEVAAPRAAPEGSGARTSDGAAEPPPRAPSVAALDDARLAGILAGLLERRDGALMARDSGALAALSVPGGPVAQADASLVAALRASGTRLTGLDTDVIEVRHVAVTPDGIVVDAVLAQAAHEREVGGASRTVAAPAPGCARIVLTAAADAPMPTAAPAADARILSSGPCD
ncbi:protein kinase domain-containing protein [Georgenia sp. MJ170]|uniref:protein kinase domain-containing protein n=1 Tax=Georgenia sunbinii TaxID=3117728 RepID=UPI002F26577E